MKITLGELEAIYEKYNKFELISPDPLEFVWRYGRDGDREAVGLIASSFAYGRVGMILSSVGRVLGTLGGSPADALREEASRGSAGLEHLTAALGGFKHRFTDGEETARFLYGIGRVMNSRGSLEALFAEGMGSGIIAAMDSFAATLLAEAGLERSSLLPRASLGSACKRLALFLRWMARSDGVDPGVWRSVPASAIIVPMDIHMHRVARALGACTRKAADGRAALETTASFAALSPDDPVKYDFALTRFGIRPDMDEAEFLKQFKEAAR